MCSKDVVGGGGKGVSFDGYNCCYLSDCDVMGIGKVG